MADGSVTINITGDAKGFEKELKSVKTEIDGLGKKTDAAGKSGSGFGKVMSAGCKVAAAAAAATATGIGAIVVASTKVGASFEAEMSKVQALSGASDAQMQQLTAAAREMGATTQFSATEAASALSYMALAGWDANQSASALPGVLNLAAASSMDLAAASDMVTDYMSAFNMSCEQAGYFADVLAYAQSHSNTTTTQLGDAFKNCSANMAAAGQDVETTTSLLAKMADQSLKGSEAGTALAAIMRDITAKMEDGTIKIGGTSIAVQDANGNFRDLTDILKDVESATDGMGSAQKASALSAVFTADSIKGLNFILNAGVDSAADFEEQLRKSSGTAEQMADTMNDNLSGAVQSLKSHAESLGIAIYNSFAVQLKDAVNLASNALTKLTNGFETGGISGAFDQLAQLAQVGIQSFVRQAPAATQAAAQIINSFASGLAQGIPDILAQALPLITKFTESIRENAGTLISAGLNIVVQLAQGIANSLPVLITYIPGIITNIAGIINDNAPLLLAAGVEVVATLAQGIIQAIPVLIANLPAIIQAIVAVFSAFNWAQCGQTVVNGVRTGISALGSAMRSAGSSAINAFKGINWANAGTAVCNFIHNAISGAASLIASALRTVGTNGINAFKGVNWAGVGRAIVGLIRSAISGAASLVASALRTTATTGMNAFKSVNWGSVGKQIINGIVSGIKGAASALFSTLTSLAKNALNTAKSALGIHSPSRVFRDVIGEMIPAGIAVGIERNTETAVNAATHMARRVISGAGISVGRNMLTSGTHVAAANAGTSYTTRNVYTTSDSQHYIDYHPTIRCDEPVSARKQRAIQKEHVRQLSKAVKK